MIETKLHSGQFTDYDGNIIEVEIFKKIDLNIQPASLSFGVGTGSSTVKIWSRDGDAILYDFPYEWITYRQLRSERLPGSDYYMYTYQITVSANNTGAVRSADLNVGLETGPVVGALTTLKVTQNG